MNFAEADRRYQQLQQEHRAGKISDEEFDNALREAMVQDAQGRWWSKSRDSGSWNVYDQATGQWSEATPPVEQPPAFTPPPPPAPADPSLAYASQGQMQPAAGGAQAYQAPSQSGGPVSQGMSLLLYAASFFIPLVGLIVFLIYRTKPYPSDRTLATVALVIGIVSILLSCGCCGLYTVYYGSLGSYTY